MMCVQLRHTDRQCGVDGDCFWTLHLRKIIHQNFHCSGYITANGKLSKREGRRRKVDSTKGGAVLLLIPAMTLLAKMLQNSKQTIR